MMDFDLINQAMAQPLQSAGISLGSVALPMVWAGQSADPERPFIFYQRIVSLRRDRTLDNTGQIEEGYLSISVVDEFGKFGVRSEQLAGEIAALYPRGSVLPFAGGVITLFEWPVLVQAYRDGPDWRQPMRVNYVAEET